MLTDEELARWIVDDDAALKLAVSLEGRALFLLLALDHAAGKSALAKTDAALINAFMRDSIRFLSGAYVSSETYEDYIRNRNDEGFLANSESQPESNKFWMFVTGVCCWFGGVVAELYREISYLNDYEDADSINRIFRGKIGLPFAPQDYAVKALRFALERFPKQARSAGPLILKGRRLISFPPSHSPDANNRP